MILAVDPGTEQSAVVRWDGQRIWVAKMLANEHCLEFIRVQKHAITVAVEMVACYGMPVGREVFETCLLIGRIREIAYQRCLDGMDMRLIYRKDVKLHLCQSMRAKDSNIRQALIDRLGSPGTKNAPGITYGISKHLWAALAIAVYAHDTI